MSNLIQGGLPHEHSHTPNRFAVIPTPDRLGADPRFSGKGITIAFLDSGFFPHPDLVEPENRILAFKDISGEQESLEESAVPQATDWHGTQTSVVAAGNGSLSDGLYRGLAADASLVLVKVSHQGRITDENIVRGLEWVIENQSAYNIRIVNLSLGGDLDVSFRESEIDRLAERAVQAGMVVIVAAGNTGCGDSPRPIPPANAPSVITVGGYDDGNRWENSAPDLYCSNFGLTIDGLVKPELIAPAMWVAAPILPCTGFYDEAEALSRLAAAPDYLLLKLAEHLLGPAGLEDATSLNGIRGIRAAVESRLVERKIISTHYQHVDGTSFASPVVASVVAQMLEANPALSPHIVKNLLVSTADRLSHHPLLRQGYGMLNARRAVEAAAGEHHTGRDGELHPPRIENDRLIFRFHHDNARSVALAADFNRWNPTQSKLSRQPSGLWKIELETLPPGTYQYKFVVDEIHWIDDPHNGLKIPDGHGGFNSLLHLT